MLRSWFSSHSKIFLTYHAVPHVCRDKIIAHFLHPCLVDPLFLNSSRSEMLCIVLLRYQSSTKAAIEIGKRPKSEGGGRKNLQQGGRGVRQREKWANQNFGNTGGLLDEKFGRRVHNGMEMTTKKTRINWTEWITKGIGKRTNKKKCDDKKNIGQWRRYAGKNKKKDRAKRGKSII